jgi:ribosomal protein S18 acetylase RimI-like enzyme
VFDDTPVHERRTRVAIDVDRVVGFATIRESEGVFDLDDLFVDPDSMRQGIGRLLVNDAAETARCRGATRLDVTANGHAWDFYTAAGFIVDGVAETQFGSGHRMHLDVRG